MAQQPTTQVFDTPDAAVAAAKSWNATHDHKRFVYVVNFNGKTYYPVAITSGKARDAALLAAGITATLLHPQRTRKPVKTLAEQIGEMTDEEREHIGRLLAQTGSKKSA